MYKDAEKRRECQRRWYYNHKEQARYSKNKRKAEIIQWFKDYKSTLACCKCGENHPACLSFHHPNNDKILEVSYMVRQAWSIKRIQEEIDKCDVTCENCHRKDTWGKYFAGVV